jgi:hypothetical protein
MKDNEATTSFVSLSGYHYLFPFDSAKFRETYSFEPLIDIKAVTLNNRVAGFYLPCDTFTLDTEAGSAHIFFELRRNPLIVYTAVFLLVTAAIFAGFITMFVETGALPQAVAAYFFGVWTIRGLFGLTAEGFPTIFDIAIVLLVLFITLLMMLRFLGLRQVILSVGRYGINFVRMLEGRKLLPAPAAAESAKTHEETTGRSG